MSKDGLNSELHSLERMAIDFGREKFKWNKDKLSQDYIPIVKLIVVLHNYKWLGSFNFSTAYSIIHTSLIGHKSASYLFLEELRTRAVVKLFEVLSAPRFVDIPKIRSEK
ncbi:hypothetical protein BY996DRAFT_6453407 [Phakopsora pachyrhizi]|nr:hypothetical protein BY996DRAFT_6453407 [Phakopsora pachyrhizi]